MKKILQLKLSSGEELIGHVTSFSNTVMITNALLIEKIYLEDEDDRNSYYTMRNWLYNQFEIENNSIKLNPTQILAEFNPSENTIKQYYSTLDFFDNRRIESLLDSGSSMLELQIDKSRLN